MEQNVCWNLMCTICRSLSRGGVEAGSIALVAKNVRAVADELGIPMLL